MIKKIRKALLYAAMLPGRIVFFAILWPALLILWLSKDIESYDLPDEFGVILSFSIVLWLALVVYLTWRISNG